MELTAIIAEFLRDNGVEVVNNGSMIARDFRRHLRVCWDGTARTGVGPSQLIFDLADPDSLDQILEYMSAKSTE